MASRFDEAESGSWFLVAIASLGLEGQKLELLLLYLLLEPVGIES